MKRCKWLITLLLAALLVGGGALLLWRSGFFQSASSLAGLHSYIERFYPYSYLVFFLVQFLSVMLAPIPNNIMAVAGAVLFGTWPAFLLTALAVLSGSVVVFLLARALGRTFADRLVSKTISDRYLDIIKRKRDVFLILVFLFPFFPDDLICILAGLTDIPLRRFFIIVLATRPWGLLAACALGGSAISIPLWGMALLGIAGIAVFVVCMRYGDQWEAAVLRRFNR